MLKFLNRILSRKRFRDGSVIRPSTKESLIYEHQNAAIDIDFLHDEEGKYQIYIPEGVTPSVAADLIKKVEEYCNERGYCFVIYVEEGEGKREVKRSD